MFHHGSGRSSLDYLHLQVIDKYVLVQTLNEILIKNIFGLKVNGT